MNKTELVALARAFILAGRRHTGDTFGRLTRYKTPSNYAGAEWPEFFPVYSHHRDSGHLHGANRRASNATGANRLRHSVSNGCGR